LYIWVELTASPATLRYGSGSSTAEFS